MKSYRNLWPELTSLENLFAAARRARRGKRTKPACAAFEFRLEGEVLALRRRLMDGSYGFGPYTEFEIRDRKPGRIAAAPYRDRVRHHAVVQVLEPQRQQPAMRESEQQPEQQQHQHRSPRRQDPGSPNPPPHGAGERAWHRSLPGPRPA